MEEKTMKPEEFNQEYKLAMKDPIRKAVFLSGIWKTKEDIERITNDFKNKLGESPAPATINKVINLCRREQKIDEYNKSFIF